MGKTIVEKILSRHAGGDLKAGDFAICKVDFTFGQDGTSSIIIDRLKELGVKKIKTKFCMVIDHNSPSPNQGASSIHKKMRNFAKEMQVELFDIGCGICHQVIPESGLIRSGDLVLGADSHTCTYGALGAFASGVGSTDLAITLATGRNWLRVPQTIKIIVKGKLPFGVFAKDIILHIIKDLKADGATYKAIEFQGPVINRLDMDGRFTICNMAVEMGAECAFMPNHIQPDPDAKYRLIKEYDISKLQPQVACPHQVDNVVDIKELKNVKIDQAFIGTCTNGRLEDLKIAARVLNGRAIKKGIKFIIAPASRSIFLDALRLGIIGSFINSGAVVISPGCGPCVGSHNGIPADEEVVISTANRNFKGRMGNPNAFIYLASPATVAASAIEGRIADPRRYIRKE